MALTRRRFLGFTAGALAAAGGVGSIALFRGCAPTPDGLRILDGHQFQTARAMAEAMFPAAAAEEDAPGEALARALDGWLADEPDWVQSQIGRALLLFEFGPAIFDRGLRPFHVMTTDERRSFLGRCARGEDVLRRKAIVALRRFFALVHYDHPARWPEIGYDGPRSMRRQP